jgi:hypothetical protein
MKQKEPLVSEKLLGMLRSDTQWRVFDDVWTERATAEDRDQRYKKGMSKNQAKQWLLRQNKDENA